MARQVINLGTPPSGVDGDTERVAWDKVNLNFNDLYNNSGEVINVNIGGGLSQSLYDFVSDSATARTYGAIGDGNSHPLSARYSTLALAQAVYPHATSLNDEIDWAAIQMSINERKSTIIPEGNYLVNNPIVIDSADKSISGAGDDVTVIHANTDIDAIISFGSSSARCSTSNLRLSSGSFESKCLSIDGIYHNFNSIEFYSSNSTGNSPIALCFSSYNRFNNCRFRMLTSECWGLWIDNRVDGGLVISNFLNSCIFSNSGNGVWIKKTHASSPRTEGSLFNGTFFINTGLKQLLVDSHYGIQIVASSFEECAGTAVDLNGIDRTQIVGSTIGVAASSSSPCLRLAPNMGKGTIITSNQFRGGEFGILAEASVSSKISGVEISSNVFDGHSLCAVSLDSVDNCSVSNNNEVGGNPARGSVNTHRTNSSGGVYFFESNSWATDGAAFFDPLSKYIASEQIGGPKMVNSGANLYSTPISSTTITHDLIATPRKIQVTPEGNVGSFQVSNVDQTTFAIIWDNSVACKWHWEASI